jgi:hypothetical protein
MGTKRVGQGRPMSSEAVPYTVRRCGAQVFDDLMAIAASVYASSKGGIPRTAHRGVERHIALLLLLVPQEQGNARPSLAPSVGPLLAHAGALQSPLCPAMLRVMSGR